MNPPLYNPSIPYVGPVPGGVLSVGALLRVQGTPHATARCFAINLQCGPNMHPRDDIALHLSPVFSPPPRVVRNSIQQQQWGPEESHGDPFPLVAGQGFEILVLVEHDHYKIAINGAHYAEFRHRLPIHQVTHVAIDGEVSVGMLHFEGSVQSSAPPPGPLYPPLGGDTAAMPMPMPVPVSGRVSPYGNLGHGAQYPAAQPYPAQPYPSQPGYPAGSYPGGGYPGGGYPGGAYPAGQYPPPGAAYPGQAVGTHFVPHPGDPHKQHSGLGMGTGLGAGLAAGAAALAGGSLLKHGMSHGGYPKHKSSLPIPISGNLGKGLAVGAGALAGAALLKKVNPLKAKKMFKHKHKHGWKGWSSSSSSSSSEEE
ncbi:unnamed protein product [Ixodes persulcatus]